MTFVDGGIKKIKTEQGEQQTRQEGKEQEKMDTGMTTWLEKRGFHCVYTTEGDFKEAKKLFDYIDYNKVGYLTKEVLGTFLDFVKAELLENEAFLETNIIFSKLSK